MKENFEDVVTPEKSGIPKELLEVETSPERALTEEEKVAFIKNSEIENAESEAARQAEAVQTEEKIDALKKELGIPTHSYEEAPELEEKEGDIIPPPPEKQENGDGENYNSYSARMVEQHTKRIIKERPSFLARLLHFFVSKEKSSFKKGVELTGVLDQKEITETTHRKEQTYNQTQGN